MVGDYLAVAVHLDMVEVGRSYAAQSVAGVLAAQSRSQVRSAASHRPESPRSDRPLFSQAL